MDSLTYILMALSAGAGVVGQTIATKVVEDAYQSFRTLVRRKFNGKESAERALRDFEIDQEQGKAALKQALLEAQVDQDPQVLIAAQQMIAVLQVLPGVQFWGTIHGPVHAGVGNQHNHVTYGKS
jgi:hypothetical protein